jgi:hypothetical protein
MQPVDRNWSRKRFSIHRAGAKKRGIPFELTFEEWDHWWLSNGIDKNTPYVKGTVSTPSQKCMCRTGDTGSYRLDNIYCATQIQNIQDRHINKPNVGNIPANKGITGIVKQSTETVNKRVQKLHKPIQTPDGLFNSRKAAAEFYKVDPGSINYKMMKNPKEFYYV